MDLGGYATDDYGDEEEEDDVDGIVDPLAGLRNDADDDDYPAETGAATDDSRFDSLRRSGGRRRRRLGDVPASDADEDTLDLTSGQEEPSGPKDDELLLDADRLAERDEPVQLPRLRNGRRRGLVSGVEGVVRSSGRFQQRGAGGGQSSGGSMLSSEWRTSAAAPAARMTTRTTMTMKVGLNILLSRAAEQPVGDFGPGRAGPVSLEFSRSGPICLR